MWPFQRKRRGTDATLGRFISPGMAEEILSHSEDTWPAPRKVFIGYNIVQVRDEDAERLNERINIAVDIVEQNRGIVNARVISLLVAMFGAPVPLDIDPAEVCQNVAMQLVRELGSDVKVLYGSGEAMIGSFGAKQRMTYQVLLPKFSRRLETICAMEYGSMQELDV